MKTTRYNASNSANNNVNKEETKVKPFNAPKVKTGKTGIYYVLRFNLAGQGVNYQIKDGSSILSYMTNGSIIKGRFGVFAEFRLVSNLGNTVDVTAVEYDNDKVVQSHKVNTEVLQEELVGHCDAKFKFDLNCEAEDVYDLLTDYDNSNRVRSLEVVIPQTNFGVVKDKLVQYGDSEYLSVTLSKETTFNFSKDIVRSGIDLSERASNAIGNGRIFDNVSNEDKLDALISTANPRSARKKAAGKAKAAAAKAAAAKAAKVTPVTTQAAAANAPAQPQVDVATPDVVDVATLQAQIAALAAQLAAVTSAQAVPAPTVTTEVAPVTEVETVVEPIIEEVVETSVVDTPAEDEEVTEAIDFFINNDDEDEDVEFSLDFFNNVPKGAKNEDEADAQIDANSDSDDEDMFELG